MSSNTSDAPVREKIINPVQLAAGAGASVTAAVAGSFLGVAGTLIGAAVASVVSSVAVAVYKYAIETTGVRIRRRPDGSVEAQPVRERTPLAERLRAVGWKKLLIPAVLIFAAVLVVLTGTEAIAGKPVSAVVTGTQANGTTLTQVGNGNVGAPQPVTPVVGDAPAPSTGQPSASSTVTTGSSEEPSPSATATAPQETPSATMPSPTTGEEADSPSPSASIPTTSSAPSSPSSEPTASVKTSRPTPTATSVPSTAISGAAPGEESNG